MNTATTANTMTDPAGTPPGPVVTDTNVTVASPVVDPSANAATTDPVDPVKVEGDAGAVGDPAAVADPTKANSTTPDWAQKRINELTAKRYEAERKAKDSDDARVAAENRAAELLKQVSKASTATDGTDPNKTGTQPNQQMTEDEINRRAYERAQQIAAATRFNESCNSIVDNGKKEFKDSWDEAVKNLGMVGAIGEKVSPEFLETAIELKEPHKILHYLGTHMDEGARIAALSGKKMAMELARIEAQLSAPPVVASPAPLSQAPAPVIPVGGGAKPGAPTLDDPALDSANWFKLRDQQIMERRNRYKRA